MSDHSALKPFHAWIPIECRRNEETELHLSSDGETIELVFVTSGGTGMVHQLLPTEFLELLALSVRYLRPAALRAVR